MRDTVSYIAMQLTDASSGCVKFMKPGICFHSTYFVLYIKSICTAVYFVALSRVGISDISGILYTSLHWLVQSTLTHTAPRWKDKNCHNIQVQCILQLCVCVCVQCIFQLCVCCAQRKLAEGKSEHMGFGSSPTL